jgi:hypothetical protein
MVHMLLQLSIVVLLFFEFKSVNSSCAFLNNCSGHGKCTLNSKCKCDDGWGSDSDFAVYKAPDCSLRVCPVGVAWSDMPTTNVTAHSVAECSNAGICDRSTGVCKCFKGYIGRSCNKKLCPNDCSGHGICKSMSRLGLDGNAYPAGNNSVYGLRPSNITWDQQMIYGCSCDSSWSVGIYPGQRQKTEWFGPDCSMSKCLTMSLCHYITMSLHHYVTTSLCHYVTTSLCHYVTTLLSLLFSSLLFSYILHIYYRAMSIRR